ncbi:PREDICTED: remorin isoform X2 [Prunus mume]|uniref:Remorin isoform X2 n=1 Tax=Prunus mume TaxID=102107 RepID=A0ABM1LK29_PRUMU|nr:PREDICTED: remorin isoform X2 [Prunus mume]
MEPLLKQIRVRFSGVRQEKTEHDRRISPQKAQSFKEKRKPQNWFQRQLSGKMSQDYDSNKAIEHATAVAAAAYAIKSIEDSAISDQKKTGNEPKTSLVRIKSKKEETAISKPEPGRVSKLFPGSTKSTPEREHPDGTATTGKVPGKAPSIKKTPTFADKQLNSTDSPSNETMRQSATEPGTRKTQADIWEENKLAMLKERYEKQNATILSWESKKKKKTRRRLSTKESEIEKKRVKAQRKFNRDMEHIKQIAEGARAQAEERYRNEVLKAKEKANAIRKTGKAPTSCFCF